MKLFTIGFTKKNAERFFRLLDRPDLQRVADIRLNNRSQLAGFTRQDDLRFFLARILGKGYVHLPRLAPSTEMLRAYREGAEDWSDYERAFLTLLDARGVHDTATEGLSDGDCLLCSEPTPEFCHRRLVAEHFARLQPDIDIIHLV